jgi:predicted lipoprotein with Yx(FWY)xxD motif
VIRKASPSTKISLGGGLAVLALLAAACGSSGGGSTASASSAGSSAAAPASSAPAAGAPAGSGSSAAAGMASLNLASRGDLGSVLVDSQGHTLYLFEADKTSTSTCAGACASAWPPAVVSGMPTAGAGVNARLIGTTKRADGTMELTYNNHPLYRFSGDAAPTDAKGQDINGFGASWYVVTAAGQKVDNDEHPAAPAATSGDSNYHY